MKATLYCGGGSCPCPHIYKTDAGTYLVQGTRVEVPEGVVVGNDELVVEVPASLLDEFVSLRRTA